MGHRRHELAVRLGRPVDLAATAQWRGATITKYCRSVIVEIADIPSIWYGAFGNTPVARPHRPGPRARR